MVSIALKQVCNTRSSQYKPKLRFVVFFKYIFCICCIFMLILIYLDLNCN